MNIENQSLKKSIVSWRKLKIKNHNYTQSPQVYIGKLPINWNTFAFNWQYDAWVTVFLNALSICKWLSMIIEKHSSNSSVIVAGLASCVWLRHHLLLLCVPLVGGRRETSPPPNLCQLSRSNCLLRTQECWLWKTKSWGRWGLSRWESQRNQLHLVQMNYQAQIRSLQCIYQNLRPKFITSFSMTHYCFTFHRSCCIQPPTVQSSPSFTKWPCPKVAPTATSKSSLPFAWINRRTWSIVGMFEQGGVQTISTQMLIFWTQSQLTDSEQRSSWKDFIHKQNGRSTWL